MSYNRRNRGRWGRGEGEEGDGPAPGRAVLASVASMAVSRPNYVSLSSRS